MLIGRRKPNSASAKPARARRAGRAAAAAASARPRAASVAAAAANVAAANVAFQSLESRCLLSAVMSIENIGEAGREGSPYRPVQFRISNSGSEGAYVNWTVMPGSAEIGTDLPADIVTGEGASEMVWVPAGGEALVSPSFINDYYPEPTETFSLALSVPEQGTNVIIAGSTAQGSIEDDDVTFTATTKTVTAGDEIEWGVRATDYQGNPVPNLAVYVENAQGGIGTTYAHDLTDGDGYADLGLRGLGLGSGYITVRAYDEFKVDYRSAPQSFRNKSAAPRMNWIPAQVGDELIASFDGLVRIGVELQKWDGSGPLRKAGLPIEWGMDHTGDYAERQADFAGGDGATDNFGRAYVYVKGNVVQRMFRDMDPTPTGTSVLWAKYPITSTFKKVNVRSKAPVIDLRVANHQLQSGDPNGGGRSTLEVSVTTSQGLPVIGSRILVTAVEANDLFLGFLNNDGGGGGPASNTVFSGYTNESGVANFEAQVATFAPPGTTATVLLVAQCAGDSYYSWRNADIETLQIV
jgi:hypothetical protein